MDLTQEKCVACEGGFPSMALDKINKYLKEVKGWELIQEAGVYKIKKTFKFKDFTESMKFVNEIAELAEDEQHHPDILIRWNRVTVTSFTHAIKGLFENDFIIAAKADKIFKEDFY
ncbi:MAG: 4a-hydroxytetrahydrobiopterin dehydratase [Nanoarchaeota archaeon]